MFELVDDVKNPEQLKEFALKEQAKYDMRDLPQFKIYLIPDYMPGKSVLVFKTHHNFSDGLGIATLFQCFNGNYDSSALPKMKPVGFCKSFLIFMISPLLMLYTLIWMQLLGLERNSILKDEQISGKKTFGYVPDLDMARMKLYCKEHKCTINDYCASLFSWSLSQYLKSEERRETDERKKVYAVPPSVRLAIPFSLRQPFKKLNDVRMINNFGSLLVDLKVCDNFDDSLKDCKQVFNRLKTSLMPFGILYLTKIPAMLPYGLPKLVLQDLTKKFSVIYTNLNASTQCYHFDGKKDLEHYFLVPGYGRVSTGFAICTIGPRMSLAAFSDEV